MATGVICERFTWEGLFALQRIAHWRICDAERLAEARQRLDLIASSVGMADLGQTAYASLTCAVGLDRLLYRGRSRRAERDRLREIVAGRWTTSPAAPDAATFAAIRAAADAVTHAAQAARAAAVASVGRYSTG